MYEDVFSLSAPWREMVRWLIVKAVLSWYPLEGDSEQHNAGWLHLHTHYPKLAYPESSALPGVCDLGAIST